MSEPVGRRQDVTSEPNPAVRALVSRILTALAQVLTPGKIVALEWDRSGAALFNLMAGDDWTVENIYGRTGRLVALGDVGPARNPEVSYKINGDDLQIQMDVLLPGIMARMKPGPVGASESEPVGAIGLMTVLSCLSIVWSLLHPSATLMLPGTMSMALSMVDGALHVTFTTPPTVTIVWGLRFAGTVNSVVLTETALTIGYKVFGFENSQTRTW